jgi:adenine-specific DNA-methyltransferase
MTTEIDKLDLSSMSIPDDKKARLRELIPEAVTEGGKVDFDRLKLALGETVDVGKERYGMNWPGKAECFKAVQTPSIATLLPCPTESIDFDCTENLIVEGDSLEVLKLLQKSYLGKIKLIYIDPPYNTGNDFIYPDDYAESLQTYLEYTGQVDAAGHKFGTNNETDGRFHSKWLNMMYPRLYLARNLLNEEGIIAAQIGDTELPNLRRLLDEIFGEENYVNTVAVKAKVSAGASGGGEDKRLKKNVEFVLIYARDIEALSGFTHCFTEEPLMDVIQDMRDAGQSWKYTSVLLDEGKRTKITTTVDGEGNPIDVFLHEGIRRTSLRDICEREALSEADAYRKYLPKIFSDTNAQTSIRTRVIAATRPLADGQMYSVEYVPTSGRDKGKRVRHFYVSPTVRRVIWLSDVAYEQNDKVIKRERTGTLWDDISYNNIGKEGGIAFPNGKKPVELLRRVLGLLPTNDGIILDFFAGSGTTAHAAIAHNHADGGNRKFILIQLPEPADQPEFKTITDLTVARVKNVIKEFAADRTGRLKLGDATEPDLGFRLYKLAESNFKPWDAGVLHESPALEKQLELHVNHIRKGRTDQDILYEILLKSGFPLTTPVEAIALAGKAVYSVAGGQLLICLERELSLEMIRALAERKPERVVCLDEGFAGNDQLKTNAAHIFEPTDRREAKSDAKRFRTV